MWLLLKNTVSKSLDAAALHSKIVLSSLIALRIWSEQEILFLPTVMSIVLLTQSGSGWSGRAAESDFVDSVSRVKEIVENRTCKSNDFMAG